MIFECGPDGADEQVCREIVGRIFTRTELSTRTLSNKRAVLGECGPVASELLSDGCVRVIILWDLRPSWPDPKQKPCRRAEREAILASLTNASVSLSLVKLVCITNALEAWLLADEDAVGTFLSRPTHRVRVQRTRKPESVRDPKGALIGIFNRHIGRPYVDRDHAVKIVRAMNGFGRIQRVPSFERFCAMLA